MQRCTFINTAQHATQCLMCEGPRVLASLLPTTPLQACMCTCTAIIREHARSSVLWLRRYSGSSESHALDASIHPVPGATCGMSRCHAITHTHDMIVDAPHRTHYSMRRLLRPWMKSSVLCFAPSLLLSDMMSQAPKRAR